MDESLAIAQALKYAEEFRHLYVEQRTQRRRAEEALAGLVDSYATTVRALAAALELRDDMTGGHAERVTALALRSAQRAAPDLAADPELQYGFLLHDIGKIGIPDAILLKPGPLDAAEEEVMRRHPELGERILARVPYLSRLASQVVLSHHERWDGLGYPHGLSGDGIPLAARIFTVADAFDAMTSDRPYRKAISGRAARAEIERSAGSQFDPALVEAFLLETAHLRKAA